MKGLCVVAPTEPLLEKAHRAVITAVADTGRISHFFCGDKGQSVGKQRIVDEKAPMKKQNVEAFEQSLHPY